MNTEPIKCNVLTEDDLDPQAGFVLSVEEYNKVFNVTFDCKKVTLEVDGAIRNATLESYKLVNETEVFTHRRELFISNSKEPATHVVELYEGAIYRVGSCMFSCEEILIEPEPINIYIYYTDEELYNKRKSNE